MTDYLSRHSDAVDRHQEILDVHVPSAATGVCLACGAMDCPQREAAMRWFHRCYVLLPRRRPGASQPELIGARRIRVPRGPERPGRRR
jgi:hypothetical protein